MQIVTSVGAMQRLALSWRRLGMRIGFVPTMGCLHEGHLSLVRRARRIVGKAGKVVVSIYVNPTQFGPDEDLASYPRDMRRDRRLCHGADVDLLLVPRSGQMYSSRKGAEFSTWVVEERLSSTMEGTSRPTHFRGVATVVAKLLNIVLPDVAVFGSKDFQQTAVIKRIVRDLNIPVHIVVAPTIRERDGLALSSRNQYLSAPEREQAVALWQAIGQARRAVRETRAGVPSNRLRSELKWLIETRPSVRVDYIEFFDSVTLQSTSKAQRGSRMALAVFVGKTRLIDNARL